MPYYRAVGEIPRKRHTQFRGDDGLLLSEELMGVEGFSGESALLYHRGRPTDIVAAESVEERGRDTVANRPLLPRHFRSHALAAGGDLVTGRRLLLGNKDVRLLYAVASGPSDLYRNATGDELVYIESGRARLESSFGVIDVDSGDYVVIPTSTTHRWLATGDEPVRALVMEASGHIAPPSRYLSTRGQFLEQSPYCERDLRAPTAPFQTEGTDVPVLVRQRQGLTRYTYAHHPFDVVGWDGSLYPYAFNIADFEPITGRVHQPPHVHQTFGGPGFVVCSFVPRLLDYHPRSIPSPYNHANVDSDEVLFYVSGDFVSRKGAGIAEGSLSLHPSGFTHGPQPGAAEASIGQTRTDEIAVMLDTFAPLDIGTAGTECEEPDYAWSWSRA